LKTFFKSCFKILEKKHHSLVYFAVHLVCAIAALGLREPNQPGDMIKSPFDTIKITRYIKIDDVRRDSMINFMVTFGTNLAL
jgi:hypothetical protein